MAQSYIPMHRAAVRFEPMVDFREFPVPPLVDIPPCTGESQDAGIGPRPRLPVARVWGRLMAAINWCDDGWVGDIIGCASLCVFVWCVIRYGPLLFGGAF